MSLKASRSTMVAVAAGWDGVAEELGLAQGEISPGDHQGSAFGLFAQRAKIDKEHDAFIAAMIDAMGTGKKKAEAIADALRETAKDFGATDTDVADSFHHPGGTPRTP